MNLFRSTLMALAFTGLAATALADEGRVYDEGPVVEVTYVRTAPGHFDDYMKFLATTYRKVMEANKAAGLILDYNIYQATPRSPQDPDLVLTTVFANMAALDRLEDFEAVSAKVVGSMETQSQGARDREALREVLGSQLMRKLVLK